MNIRGRSVCSLIVLICSVVCLSSLAAAVENYTATIKVDLQDEKAPVPAALYGILMEEISHAFDGGIYRELIQNRSFEEGVLPPGTKLIEKDDGSLKMELDSFPPGVPEDRQPMPWPWAMNCGWDLNRRMIGWSLNKQADSGSEMKLTEANPMNDASSLSLELTVAGDGPLSLVNSGYWGINLQEGNSYRLTFYLRHGTSEGGITVSLQDKDGKLAFVDAEESTFVWARQMGYERDQLTTPTRTGDDLDVFSYLNGDVIHCKVKNEGHGAIHGISEEVLLGFLQSW